MSSTIVDHPAGPASGPVVASTRDELRAARESLTSRDVAVVMTMGALHDGHAQLVRRARAEHDHVIVTIFLNPLQFGPKEDLSRYPRTFDADMEICTSAGVDVVFAPTPDVVYPDGDPGVRISAGPLGTVLEGQSRPGHFDGVCTVVAKLFNIVLPHVAIFGEKDAQQLRVIRRLVRDLRFPVEIIPGPTAREPDGLARSSRNQYLTPAERPQAVCLRRALDVAERLFADGARDPQTIIAAMRAFIAPYPAAKIDYIEIVDDETLQPLAGPICRPALVALAVWVGKPRLIDNAILRPGGASGTR